MKHEEWKTYRTRFLVQAKQISSTLTFVDHLGRQHCGRKGDYLVESSDGVLSIAPRRIFEDIYVPMSPSNQPLAAFPAISGETALVERKPIDRRLDRPKFEELEIERLTLPRTPPARQRISASFKKQPSRDVTMATAAKPALSLSNGAVPPKRSEAEPASILDEACAPPRGRKLPQPYRDRRPSSSRLSLMGVL
ncbi:MAG TPA: hypothetical protein VGM18_12280 [Candidatus Sulfotelmatobacter sp.]|jgi:hypothetical protein